jgi:hypothetical protein
MPVRAEQPELNALRIRKSPRGAIGATIAGGSGVKPALNKRCSAPVISNTATMATNE